MLAAAPPLATAGPGHEAEPGGRAGPGQGRRARWGPAAELLVGAWDGECGDRDRAGDRDKRGLAVGWVYVGMGAGRALKWEGRAQGWRRAGRCGGVGRARAGDRQGLAMEGTGLGMGQAGH